jgi:hypothetical protein
LGRGEGDGKRKSRDKVEKKIQRQGGKCRCEETVMEWIEENGWEVLNGNKQGDEEGEWTYIGSGGGGEQ